MTESSLTVAEYCGSLVVDSRLIAIQLEIQHKPLMRTIDKYLTELQQFGQVVFQNATVQNSVGAVNVLRFAYLNEAQATFLMTLSRNTPQVVACKVNLVTAFEKAKETIKTVIPAMSEEIRKLELENENLRLKKELGSLHNSMISLHGAPVVLALTGREDQLIEVDRPTLEVIDETHNVRFKGQTLKQVAEYIEKKYGTRFKSGADVARMLRKVGRDDLIAETKRSLTSEYIPEEYLDEAYRILTKGDRQKLIGE